jgi:hypothetical protein
MIVEQVLDLLSNWIGMAALVFGAAVAGVLLGDAIADVVLFGVTATGVAGLVAYRRRSGHKPKSPRDHARE